MTSFKDRQTGEEAKFAHDQQSEFRIVARRNKMLGLWVAEKLGLSGTAADEYATSVIKADFEEAGDADVVRKVLADLGAGSVEVSEREVRARLAEFLETARAAIRSGG